MAGDRSAAIGEEIKQIQESLASLVQPAGISTGSVLQGINNRLATNISILENAHARIVSLQKRVTDQSQLTSLIDNFNIERAQVLYEYNFGKSRQVEMDPLLFQKLSNLVLPLVVAGVQQTMAGSTQRPIAAGQTPKPAAAEAPSIEAGQLVKPAISLVQDTYLDTIKRLRDQLNAAGVNPELKAKFEAEFKKYELAIANLTAQLNLPQSLDRQIELHDEARALDEEIESYMMSLKADIDNLTKKSEVSLLSSIDYLTEDFAIAFLQATDIEKVMFGIIDKRKDIPLGKNPPYDRKLIYDKMFADVTDPDPEKQNQLRQGMLDDIAKARDFVQKLKAQGRELVLSQLTQSEIDIVNKGYAAMQHISNNLLNYVQLRGEQKDPVLQSAQAMLIQFSAALTCRDSPVSNSLKSALPGQYQNQSTYGQLIQNPQVARQVLMPLKQKIKAQQTEINVKSIFSGYLFEALFAAQKARREILKNPEVGKQLTSREASLIATSNFTIPSLQQAAAKNLLALTEIDNQKREILESPLERYSIDLALRRMTEHSEMNDKVVVPIYQRWVHFLDQTPTQASADYHRAMTPQSTTLEYVKSASEAIVVKQGQIAELENLAKIIRERQEDQRKLQEDFKGYYKGKDGQGAQNVEALREAIQALAAAKVANQLIAKGYDLNSKKYANEFKKRVKREVAQQMKLAEKSKASYLSHSAKIFEERDKILLDEIDKKKNQLASDIKELTDGVLAADEALKQHSERVISNSKDREPNEAVNLLLNGFAFEIDDVMINLSHSLITLKSQRASLEMDKGPDKQKKLDALNKQIELINHKINTLGTIKAQAVTLRDNPDLGAREKMFLFKQFTLQKETDISKIPEMEAANKRFLRSYDAIKADFASREKNLDKQIEVENSRFKEQVASTKKTSLNAYEFLSFQVSNAKQHALAVSALYKDRQLLVKEDGYLNNGKMINAYSNMQGVLTLIESRVISVQNDRTLTKLTKSGRLEELSKEITAKLNYNKEGTLPLPREAIDLLKSMKQKVDAELKLALSEEKAAIKQAKKDEEKYRREEAKNPTNPSRLFSTAHSTGAPARKTATGPASAPPSRPGFGRRGSGDK